VSHPLSGHFSAEDSARLIRNYRYAVERMMRILGGWIALTPEVSAKLLLGRHVWDNAQHADALGRRLPELRSRAHVSEPANQAFVAFMDAIEEPERPRQTVERVVGIYRVLKPHLLATYEDHLERANEVYEPPTLRILARCADDERRHIAAGRAILGHLITDSALEARAHAWQERLGALLAAAGGVTGRGVPASARADRGQPALALSDDAGELIRLEQSSDHGRLPDELDAAVRSLGEALVGRDAAALRRWLLPSVEPGEAVESALRAAGTRASQRVVAIAKVGRQRLVKLKLEGAEGSLTFLLRWVPAEGGWRAAAIELAAVDAAHHA